MAISPDPRPNIATPANTITENDEAAKTPKQKQKEKKLNISFIENLLSRISVKDKIFFVQQVGIMVQTGISLGIALKTLAEQTVNKKFKAILADLQATVERGNLLSEGLEEHKIVFGELFVNMVRAGESSGKLEEVFKQLFVQMKKDHDIISKVKSAMIYPAVVVTAMVGVAIMVIIYVVPNLTAIFKEMGGTLPLATRVLIAISEFTLAYGIFILIAVVVAIILLRKLILTPKSRFIVHTMILKTPIAGNIIKKINLARFCRTLSSLLKTDIAIVKSFEITSNILGNELYKRALLEGKEKIKKGKNVHDSLEAYSTLFPPVIMQMIAVGEETGAIDTILEQSAVFFEDEVDQIMKNLPAIIEPVLMLILGVGVGAMAVAIIMPMYSLAEQV
ncbi:MAG: Type II secretion system F domain protein [Parcubacteria group bacterium GW2011_GWA2_38_13]|nr:MAG: Type II secretion system F domain protein [Parcubacteria group bacterium GW2011_GWA2_38_13]